MKNRLLLGSKIHCTIEKLYSRIHERFPGSSLADLCQSLLEISDDSDKTIRWIEKPNYFYRAFSGTIIIIAIVIFSLTLKKINFSPYNIDLFGFAQSLEALLNEIILAILGILSLVTFEIRQKRARAIKALNRLKSVAHIIDTHQLTKDPNVDADSYAPTESSPRRTMSRNELSRYLDYCAEMLSLTSKIGFLYVQNFDDHITNNSFNELETLTTDLANKIWLKISVLKLDDIRCK